MATSKSAIVMMETYPVRWVIDGNTTQAQILANTMTRICLAGVIAPKLTEKAFQELLR